MRCSLRLPLFVLLMVGVMAGGYGQKNDYMWLQGYAGYPHPIYDSVDSFYFGTTVLNFNYSPMQMELDSLQMNFDYTNTSYCDSNGNLLFYSNGVSVGNVLNKIIDNGDSLNAGYFQYDWDPTIQYNGYRTPQGILAIPNPANSSQYYLLYTFTDTVPLYPAYVKTSAGKKQRGAGVS